MKNKLEKLAWLSQKIGNRLDYVQGGGGNISVKISDNLMAIKASGFELKNLTENYGFAFVNHQRIAKEINKEINKPKPINADFIGLNAPNHFLFGYGMDIYGLYRQLPDMYIYKT